MMVKYYRDPFDANYVTMHIVEWVDIQELILLVRFVEQDICSKTSYRCFFWARDEAPPSKGELLGIRRCESGQHLADFSNVIVEDLERFTHSLPSRKLKRNANDG